MTSIPTLALNGEAIQLKNMRVTVSQQFQDKDQSGQTSATTKSEQGAKGKELRISGEIPFKQPEILKRIFELASATDASGNRQKYRVAHEVARAVNFRENVQRNAGCTPAGRENGLAGDIHTGGTYQRAGKARDQGNR